MIQTNTYVYVDEINFPITTVAAFATMAEDEARKRTRTFSKMLVESLMNGRPIAPSDVPTPNAAPSSLIEVRVEDSFQGKYVYIPQEIANHFSIVNILIAGVPQMCTSGRGIRAEVFAKHPWMDECAMPLSFDTAHAGGVIEIEVLNDSDRPRPFTAKIFGRKVRA